MSATPVSSQPLPDLYRAALAADPAVSAATAQVQAAEERVTQARAAYGPTLALAGTQSLTRYREAPAYDPRPFRSKQLNLQLSQPLLHTALRPALEAAQAQLEQAGFALDRMRTEAMQRLVEACFELLKSRDAVEFFQAQRAAAVEQLASATQRYRIGTAAVTDVREAQAQADTVAAQLIAAEFDLDLKQQTLTELTGQPVTGLIERGVGADRLPSLPAASIALQLSDALSRNPQVRQAQLAQVASEADVRKATQGHAPTADLSVSRSLYSDTGSITTTAPRRADSTQYQININIPLFASGATGSKVAEARALLDKARSDVDAARRTVTLAVRDHFTSARSAVSQAQGLEAAVRSSELALRANRRGYEVGMKVNAEVLDSQTKLFQAQRDLSKARYDAWLSYVKLQAASGNLAETDLAQLESILVEHHPPPLQQPQRPAR